MIYIGAYSRSGFTGGLYSYDISKKELSSPICNNNISSLAYVPAESAVFAVSETDNKIFKYPAGGTISTIYDPVSSGALPENVSQINYFNGYLYVTGFESGVQYFVRKFSTDGTPLGKVLGISYYL